MKKTILAMCFLAGSCALYAQNTGTTGTTNTDNTMTTTGSYQAYSTAPSNIQMYFTRDYPTAANVTWYQNTDWWRASYNNNGRLSHVYYNTAGDNFLVALPVTSTWVPDNIVSQATNTYGINLYDITALKAANGQPVYQIRVLDNGTTRSEWVDMNGARVTDIYRTGTDNTNTQQGGMNNQYSNPGVDRPADNGEVKIKVDKDESKMKIETDEYKMKIKQEGNETKTKIKNKKKSNTNATTTENNQ